MDKGFLQVGNKRISNGTVYATLGVVLVALVLILPVTVSRSIDIAGKILPAREWTLVRNNEGGVIAFFSDHERGVVHNYTAGTVLRGDAFRFTLSPSLMPGSAVNAGDTIVRIRSHQLAFEISRLSGELAVSRATLVMARSGEKETIIREAERALASARERADLQARLFDRQDSLFRRNLVSREVYEVARNEARVAEIEVAVAEARLQTVTTGTKPDQIRVIESQIAALEKELGVLEQQAEVLTLVSPFPGIFFSSPGADTLCGVADTSNIALMPIPVEYLSRITPGQEVTVRIPGLTELCGGTVSRLDRQVRLVDGKQVIMTTAVLHATGGGLPSRLIVTGSIEIGRVSVARYVQYWISDIVAELLGGPAGI